MKATHAQPASISAVFANNEARLLALRTAAVFGFAALTAAAALFRYPLPGTPVPATLQTLVVMLAGLLLGPSLASLSMTLYLLAGAMGAGVFAVSSVGLASFVGPTGGYLVGFLLAQPVFGLIARSGRAGPGAGGGGAARIALALLLGNAVILGLGVAWLAVWSGTSIATAATLGFWPFVPVDLGMKITLAFGVGLLVMKPVRRALQVRG